MQYANKLTTIRQIGKQNYYSLMLDVNRKNIFKHWEIINEILKRKAITKESVGKLITDNDKILSKGEDIRNEFNNLYICKYWTQDGIKNSNNPQKLKTDRYPLFFKFFLL